MKRDPLAEALIDGLKELADAIDEFEAVIVYETDVTCPVCGQRGLLHAAQSTLPATSFAFKNARF